MNYEVDASFLHALILGCVDPTSDGVDAPLAILKAKYSAALDGGMLDLVRRATEAVARADTEADRRYLNSLIDGTTDLLSEDTFRRLAPMFEKYLPASETFVLLERAATLFGDAVHEVECRLLADVAIDRARQMHGRD